jgi:hypothetical protein
MSKPPREVETKRAAPRRPPREVENEHAAPRRIATQLVEAGVPRDRIVLAFKHSSLRKYTDFAAARRTRGGRPQGFPDASEGFPDASEGFPDASEGFPDASEGFPDASEGFPDAPEAVAL